MKLHIGQMVEAEMSAQHITKAELARRLCCSRSNVYLILEKANVDVILLLRISRALGVDFFARLSEVAKEDLADLK